MVVLLPPGNEAGRAGPRKGVSSPLFPSLVNLEFLKRQKPFKKKLVRQSKFTLNKLSRSQGPPQKKPRLETFIEKKIICQKEVTNGGEGLGSLLVSQRACRRGGKTPPCNRA